MANNMTFFQRLVAQILIFCFLLWIVSWFLYQYIKDLISGRSDFGNWSSVSNAPEFNVTQVPNPAVIVRFSRSSNDISGYPLVLEFSTKSPTTCYVVYEVDVNQLHQTLVSDCDTLARFFRARGSRQIPLSLGHDKVVIDKFEHNLYSINSQTKRARYAVVVGLLSDCPDRSKEQIVVSCYVIHLRLRNEEAVDTGLMYTFWKTNWNRLLTPQVMYASRDNSATEPDYTTVNPISPEWSPSCFICLCDVRETDLRVLLPCRHAGLCPDCFSAFCTKSTRIRALGNLIVCPLCRTPVTAIMRITAPVNQQQQQRLQEQQQQQQEQSI